MIPHSSLNRGLIYDADEPSQFKPSDGSSKPSTQGGGMFLFGFALSTTSH